MATLQSLQNSVIYKIGLDASNTTETGKLTDWANEAVTEILLRTHCKIVSGTLTETSGSGDYTLDTSILRILGLSWSSSGVTFMPQRVTIQEMLGLRRATTSGGTPSAYAIAGSNLLMVWPTPAAADTLTVYYVPRPATLVNSTDTPSEIPTEFHKGIEFYMLKEAADYDDDASSAQGQRYKDDFENWIAKTRRYVNTKGGPLPRLKVNRGRTALVRHDNSIYP